MKHSTLKIASEIYGDNSIHCDILLLHNELQFIYNPFHEVYCRTDEWTYARILEPPLRFYWSLPNYVQYYVYVGHYS